MPEQANDLIFTDAFWVMTANIAGQKWMGWEERKDVSARVFERIPCDLVGFQEAGIDMWDSLGRNRGDLDIIPGMRAGEININTIAFKRARFEMLDTSTFWLSEDGTYRRSWDGSERGASWVMLKDKFRDKKILLVNVHLDNKGLVAQAKGVELILNFILKHDPKLPVIVTADSNVSVDSKDTRWRDPELRKPYDMMLQAGFTDSWVATHRNNPTRPFTYHAFQGPDYVGDEWGTYDTEWILVRGFKPLNCVIIRDSMGGIWPSDHYWMMALLNYLEDEQG